MRKIEHDNHCKQIADKIRLYAQGCYFCPMCSEEYEEGDTCPKCGEDLEPQGLIDFFNEALDIEYRIGSDREYRSVCIMIAFGGPNIYVDTGSRKVELYWWNEEGEAFLDGEVVDAIDEFMEELYNC